MTCFKSKKKPKMPSSQPDQNPKSKTLKHEILLRIPGCRVHLMEEGEAIELANGEMTLVSVIDDGVLVAAVVKVGEDLQWPLTKDEPVVKIDGLNYLFSLPMRDGDPLSYGVSFVKESRLDSFDGYLKEHSCFSSLKNNSKRNNSNNNEINWKEFAPRIEDYNNVLARAIAGGTGQIVKGIFMCSNAYTNQLQKGGEAILTPAMQDNKSGITTSTNQSTSKKNNSELKKSNINKSLKRVRKLSKMTEKMSKAMLNGVGIVSGSVMKPMINSQAGKKFLAMVPGEVLLASLDAVNRVFDAAEAAEKQTLTATSSAATRIVSQRYGENAGEATGDVLATAGHCCGTAWNVFKIRKAINPASSVSAGALKTAANLKK